MDADQVEDVMDGRMEYGWRSSIEILYISKFLKPFLP